MHLPLLNDEEARAMIGFSEARWNAALKGKFIRPDQAGHFHIADTVQGALRFTHAQWQRRSGWSARKVNPNG